MIEYVYLVQEREFIKTKEEIYKIGRTRQANLSRFNSYPNGSILLVQCICNDCDRLERELINKFKIKYELQREIGSEYFKGDCKEMMRDIYEHIINEGEKDVIVEDVKEEKEVKEVKEKKEVIVEDVKEEKEVKEKKEVKEEKEVIVEDVKEEKEVIVEDVKEEKEVIIRKEKEKEYKCSYCDYSSERKYYLKLHNEIKHKEGSIYKCNRCEKKLSSKQYLQKHEKTCKGNINRLECQGCHKVFSTSSSKCRHKKSCKVFKGC